MFFFKGIARSVASIFNRRSTRCRSSVEVPERAAFPANRARAFAALRRGDDVVSQSQGIFEIVARLARERAAKPRF